MISSHLDYKIQVAATGDYMNADYLQGAKDRAQKKQPPYGCTNREYLNGYQHMQDLLVPIEQEIVLATFKYQTVAQNAIREMEGQFRDRGDAGHSAGTTADPAYPSERSAKPSEDGDTT